MVLLSKLMSMFGKVLSKLNRWMPVSERDTLKDSNSGNRMVFKIFFTVSVLSVSGFAMWKLLKWVQSKNADKNKKQRKIVEVMFFPDAAVACRSQFTERYGCLSQNCKFSHNPELSYARLMRALASARLRLDICVFCLTCKELMEIVRDVQEKGVNVRVITDSEQVHASGSQVGALRSAGVQVRHDSTSFFMHHKFVIVDGCMLLNGSFNWTRQAITGNFENVFITTDSDILNLYQQEFNRLWGLFSPRRR